MNSRRGIGIKENEDKNMEGVGNSKTRMEETAKETSPYQGLQDQGKRCNTLF